MMKKTLGFTLIEILVTVAIVGILAALAVPSYTSFVKESRRTEATALLMEMAGKQVRFHAENNTYATKVGELGYGASGSTTYSSETDVYDLEVDSADAVSFALKATPKNAQHDDDCGELGYNSAGAKTFSGSGVTLDECW
ncbi:MAG TPA: pilus assembly protein PilE [Gammaproteobacteria bacterium]|jgi:type IV pilus assembly protein PilE|nr:pilus assembly protein PilE [Gammaproteobacteria bacterium]